MRVVAICDFLHAPQGTFPTQLASICLVVTSQHRAIILCARGALDGTWGRAWDRERSPCGLRTRLHTKETIPRFIRTFESNPTLYDIQTQQPLTDQRPEAFSPRSRCTQLSIYSSATRRCLQRETLGGSPFLKCRIYVHVASLGPFVTRHRLKASSNWPWR